MVGLGNRDIERYARVALCCLDLHGAGCSGNTWVVSGSSLVLDSYITRAMSLPSVEV